MAGVAHSEMLDVIDAVTSNLPLLDMPFEIPMQKYPFCARLLDEKKIELTGGDDIVRTIVLDESGAMKFVRPFEVAAVNIPRLIDKLRADWVLAQTDWSAEKTEILSNRTGADEDGWSRQIVKLVDTRQKDAMLSMMNGIERAVWRVDAVGTDNLTPLGIPYAVPKLAAAAAATAAGFYGGRYLAAMGPNTFGIPPATANDNLATITGGKPLWRSYCCGYTTMNRVAVKNMSKMFYSIDFQSPARAGELQPGEDDYDIFMNVDTMVDLEELARAGNQNLGQDVAMFHGSTIVKRISPKIAPVLNDTGAGEAGQYNPVYFINWRGYKIYVREGDYFTRTVIGPDRPQHRVTTTFVDLQYAMVCTRRRIQGCMNQVT